MIILKILYFGNICDEKLFKQIEQKYKAPYRTAQYNYEKAFCDETNKLNDIDIISIYQQQYFPKEKFLFVKKQFISTNEKIDYIHYINIPFIREILFFINTCIKIFVWNSKNKNLKEKCIFANIHYAPTSLAIVLMGKMLKIKRAITFTDLSLYTYSKEKIKAMKLYKKVIIKPYIKLVNKLQQSYDLYVLFSKPMNEIVNKNNKPYVVIEGIYNPNGIDFNKIEKANAILYAGKLNKEIGIQKILEVFSKIKNKDLELWFLGNGDMKDEIIKASKKDSRIKYLGFKQREEVFKYLKSAKILINLRNPNDEYTKYSFPSKTFEYMVSGTPFVTTKLEGIPKEYYNYIYVVKYEDTDIIKTIQEILNSDEKEIEAFGINARNFILKNKNPQEQVKKINNFLKDNI